MGAIGGDVLEANFNHPTLGSGTFFPKANEDSTFDLGGFRSNDDANMIDGGGRMIDQINRVRWSVEMTIASDMGSTGNPNASSDLEMLKLLASSPVQADWTISHVNGTVWKGKGKPVGDIQANGNAGTIGFKVAGGGEMKKIVG